MERKMYLVISSFITYLKFTTSERYTSIPFDNTLNSELAIITLAKKVLAIEIFLLQ